MVSGSFSLPPLAKARAAGQLSAAQKFATYAAAVTAQDLPLPQAVLDIASFTVNAHTLTARAGAKPIRLASKSVRSRELMRAVLALPGWAGVLAFTLNEACDLVASSITDDVVIGYPVLDTAQLPQLFNSAKNLRAITLMLDHPEQLALLVAARKTYLASKPGAPIADLPVRICLDLDCALQVSKLHLGALRSAIRTPEQARAAATLVHKTPGFQVVGALAYEAQIAGVDDATPAKRVMKQVSLRELTKRRAQLVAAISSVTELEFVNGGGTGSLESTGAAAEITELAAGSGLFGPHLFDNYRGFKPQPAAYFGLQVTRNPRPGVVTVSGGGWVASGAAGKDRLPRPVWPTGLTLTDLEGAGEVQTPVRCGGDPLKIGDITWWRHAKAGELAERVNQFVLVDYTKTVKIDTVSTYRGEGKAYL